mmetsp:Transcript_44873/g.130718  ORF Transcript_44873/g.130718 Transcript_44873/m.130718 type:complete len:1266 (-) Transcript_44873:88-3885(-)
MSPCMRGRRSLPPLWLAVSYGVAIHGAAALDGIASVDDADMHDPDTWRLRVIIMAGQSNMEGEALVRSSPNWQFWRPPDWGTLERQCVDPRTAGIMAQACCHAGQYTVVPEIKVLAYERDCRNDDAGCEEVVKSGVLSIGFGVGGQGAATTPAGSGGRIRGEHDLHRAACAAVGGSVECPVGDGGTLAVAAVGGTSGRTSPSCWSARTTGSRTGEPEVEVDVPSAQADDVDAVVEEMQDADGGSSFRAWGTVERTFKAFCGARQDMDGKSFAKLCKDCGLVDKALTVTDVDIVFAKVVTKGQRRICLQQFDEALMLLAEKKCVDVEDVCRRVRRTDGPVLKSTKTDAVRFHDDRSTYTGTHVQGGPEPAAKGRGHSPCPAFRVTLPPFSYHDETEARAASAIASAVQASSRERSPPRSARASSPPPRSPFPRQPSPVARRASYSGEALRAPSPARIVPRRASMSVCVSRDASPPRAASPMRHQLSTGGRRDSCSSGPHLLQVVRHCRTSDLEDELRSRLLSPMSASEGQAASSGSPSPRPPLTPMTPTTPLSPSPQQQPQQPQPPQSLSQQAPVVAARPGGGTNASRETVEDTFRAYCGSRPDMDGTTFAKLCKDCHLVDSTLNASHMDIIFSKVVLRGQRRIDFQQFRDALQLIADRKGVSIAVVTRAVATSEGPVLKYTKAEAVRFYDDKSQYTGTHAYGGPDMGSKIATSRSERDSQAWFSSLRADSLDEELMPELLLRRLGERCSSKSPARTPSTTKSEATKSDPSSDVAARRWRRLPSQSSAKALQLSSSARPPMGTDEVTMVFTDVQGSTSLWEANPSAMEQALRMHDATIRQVLAKHGGYEVTTEGDAFQICFHTAMDAVAFCLDTQTELMCLDWPAATLEHPDAVKTEDGAWNGLRVRMGVHSGKPTSVTKHEMTGRWRYAGPSVAMAKAVEGTCHGGQIVLSHQCYQLVDGQLTQLGSPQVVDLGEHLLEGHGIADPASGDEGRAVVRLVQLVPEALHYDYSSDAAVLVGGGSSSSKDGGDSDRRSSSGGRRFDPVISVRRVSPGFEQSPSGPDITLCFAFTKGAQDLAASAPALASTSLGMLRRCVRGVLREAGGYECQEDEGAFMLAFATMGDAAVFGAALQRAARQLPWPAELRARGGPLFSAGLRVAVGALSGGYTSRRPHASTGRADYFGTIVNRTARIAASANGGQILMGGEDPLAGQTGADAACSVRRLGAFVLKGIDSPMVLSELMVPDEEGRFEEFPQPKTKGRVGD